MSSAAGSQELSPAPTRGPLKIVTYNIGVKLDKDHRGKKNKADNAAFKRTLQDQMLQFGQRFSVICLQEASEKWCEDILSWLTLASTQGPWTYKWHKDAIATFYRPGDWTVPVEHQSVHVFPEHTSKYKSWRQFIKSRFENEDTFMKL